MGTCGSFRFKMSVLIQGVWHVFSSILASKADLIEVSKQSGPAVSALTPTSSSGFFLCFCLSFNCCGLGFTFLLRLRSSSFFCFRLGGVIPYMLQHHDHLEICTGDNLPCTQAIELVTRYAASPTRRGMLGESSSIVSRVTLQSTVAGEGDSWCIAVSRCSGSIST